MTAIPIAINTSRSLMRLSHPCDTHRHALSFAAALPATSLRQRIRPDEAAHRSLRRWRGARPRRAPDDAGGVGYTTRKPRRHFRPGELHRVSRLLVPDAEVPDCPIRLGSPRTPVDPETNSAREVLRFRRVDALPQLINILRGEISIVDPDGRSPSRLCPQRG